MKAWVYAGVAAAVLGVGVVVVRGVTGGSSTASPSLPRRIGAPSVLTDYSPVGTASVAFSSDQWQMDGTIDTIELTGATDDAYRRLGNAYGSTAGLSAILSPDGRRLAVTNGIIDLSTDALTAMPPAGGDDRVPQAWSADGRYLATVTYTGAGYADATGGAPGEFVTMYSAALDVYDTVIGSVTRIAQLGTTAGINGWIAAFAPDGRLAYQAGNQITVASRDGTTLGRFAVPDGTRIAGKGAWTRDGRRIAVVDQGPCGCGRSYDSRWTLATLDASTGVASGPAYRVDGVVGVRMLGWSPSGKPVVVAYEPSGGPYDPGATPVSFRGPNRLWGLEDLNDVGSARVLALLPDGGSQVLCDAFGAESADAADDIVAGGLSRAGDPPLLTEPNLFIAVILTVLGIPLLLIGLLVVRVVRRRRHRHNPLPVATG